MGRRHFGVNVGIGGRDGGVGFSMQQQHDGYGNRSRSFGVAAGVRGEDGYAAFRYQSHRGGGRYGYDHGGYGHDRGGYGYDRGYVSPQQERQNYLRRARHEESRYRSAIRWEQSLNQQELNLGREIYLNTEWRPYYLSHDRDARIAYRKARDAATEAYMSGDPELAAEIAEEYRVHYVPGYAGEREYAAAVTQPAAPSRAPVAAPEESSGREDWDERDREAYRRFQKQPLREGQPDPAAPAEVKSFMEPDSVTDGRSARVEELHTAFGATPEQTYRFQAMAAALDPEQYGTGLGVYRDMHSGEVNGCDGIPGGCTLGVYNAIRERYGMDSSNAYDPRVMEHMTQELAQRFKREITAERGDDTTPAADTAQADLPTQQRSSDKVQNV